jgi:hypothetical protein
MKRQQNYLRGDRRQMKLRSDLLERCMHASWIVSQSELMNLVPVENGKPCPCIAPGSLANSDRKIPERSHVFWAVRRRPFTMAAIRVDLNCVSKTESAQNQRGSSVRCCIVDLIIHFGAKKCACLPRISCGHLKNQLFSWRHSHDASRW